MNTTNQKPVQTKKKLTLSRQTLRNLSADAPSPTNDPKIITNICTTTNPVTDTCCARATCY